MKNLARFLGVSLTVLGIAPALADDGFANLGQPARVVSAPPRDDPNSVDGEDPPADDGVTDPIDDGSGTDAPPC